MTIDPHDLITMTEAAELANVSKAAIWKATERGELTDHWILGRIGIDPVELKAWIEKPTRQRLATPRNPNQA